jgi:UDP-N-acetylmuramoylalanine--D-glutamate ligase
VLGRGLGEDANAGSDHRDQRDGACDEALCGLVGDVAIEVTIECLPVLDALSRFAPNAKVFEVAHAERGSVMSVAVREASVFAEEGDVVLLAPAAASMDQFKDYEDRGNQFAKAIGELHG